MKTRKGGPFCFEMGFLFHVRAFGCVQNQVLSTYRKSAPCTKRGPFRMRVTKNYHWNSRAPRWKVPTKKRPIHNGIFVSPNGFERVCYEIFVNCKFEFDYLIRINKKFILLQISPDKGWKNSRGFCQLHGEKVNFHAKIQFRKTRNSRTKKPFFLHFFPNRNQRSQFLNQTLFFTQNPWISLGKYLNRNWQESCH